MADHGRKKPVDPDVVLRIHYLMLRDEVGPTALGNSLGLTKGTISHWIAGRHQPPLDRIKQIAAHFDVSVEWLLGEDLSDEQRQAQRARMKALVALSKDAPPEEAARFLQTVESFDSLKAATEAMLIGKKRSK